MNQKFHINRPGLRSFTRITMVLTVRPISLERQNPKDGYIVYLVEPMPERLQCPICDKLMRNPVQTSRGELACEYCYTSNIGAEELCPIDKEPILPGGYFKDKFKTREIQNLKCFCLFKDNGCLWNETVGTVEKHQSICEFQPERCYLCNSMLMNQTVDDHLRQCAGIVPQENCYYSKYGCAETPQSVEAYVTHLKDNTILHSHMQSKHFEKIETKSKQWRNEMQTINDTLRHDAVKMDAEIKLLNTQVFSLNNNIKEIQEAFRNMQLEVQKMVGEATQSQESVYSSYVLDELSVNIDELSVMDEKISDLDLKQQLFENTTYDGKILWKINNLKFHMQQAVTGRVTALHSAPCFTEKYGFKFCAQLYLNGDGMGKDSHLSLFLIIMKSDYDNLLTWPVQKKVIFRLINQEDTGKSIEVRFKSDQFSSSFQKPKTDMSVAAGCPMFVSKDDLVFDGYIKDDSIFIEVNVA